MADPQVTLDIGGAVSASASVVQLVQQLLTGSRSVTIEVDNNTDSTLKRYPGSGHHRHGGWAKFPAEQIDPRKADVFGSQNVGGSIATGTEGYVYYYINDPSDLQMCVLWDNPYIGDNSAKAWLRGRNASKYRLWYSYGAGNTQAPMRFQLFTDAVGGPERPKDITDYDS